MIHKACMPVYMNSGKIVADGTGGESKVLQEVLADLKTNTNTNTNTCTNRTTGVGTIIDISAKPTT